jgi:hypothetical protein
MANMIARSVCNATLTHVEFEVTKGDLQRFVAELQDEARRDPSVETFHLQIQRRGVAPPTGGTVPINNGDPVTVSVHRFP